jgi:hypothetical protein
LGLEVWMPDAKKLGRADSVRASSRH